MRVKFSFIETEVTVCGVVKEIPHNCQSSSIWHFVKIFLVATLISCAVSAAKATGILATSELWLLDTSLI